MGMQLSLKAVDLEEIRELGTGHAAVDRALGLDALATLDLSNPEALMAWAAARATGADGVLDLDKAWHVIHYLLTGRSEGGREPNCYLLSGGTDVGDPLDYGPARVLSPDQVASFLGVLSSRPTNSFRAEFSVQRLCAADIYPVSMASPGASDEEEFEYFGIHYENLRRFVAGTAAAGKGLLIWLG